MGFDDAGTFEVTTPGQPVSPNTVISSTSFNALITDLAGGLSTALCRDGQSTVSANLPMNAKKLTGLAPGTARTDSASLANIQDGTGVYVATVGGTADAITLTPSPAITAYAAGQTFRFIASGANTTAVTVAVSSLAGPKAVTKNGTTALVAGDIPSGSMVTITYDGTRFILGTQGTGVLGTMAGHLLFTDNTYDIGASGATRPRTGYFGTDVIVGANLRVAGNLVGRAAVGGHLYGLTISNSGVDATNDIIVAIGSTTHDDADPTLRLSMFLTAGLTKQLDGAWAVGTNAGMLDTGSIANGTYHIYLIMRGDTGVVDVLASTSATAPTLPANYSYKRRIGSILRESAAIVPFTQYGDEFWRTTPSLDIDRNTPGTSATTETLKVPTGISVLAILNAGAVSDADGRAYFSALTTTDTAPSNTTAPLASVVFSASGAGAGFVQTRVRTNTSGQIRARLSTGGAGVTSKGATLGWIDRRGQDA